jgi:hypothetical protein
LSLDVTKNRWKGTFSALPCVITFFLNLVARKIILVLTEVADQANLESFLVIHHGAALDQSEPYHHHFYDLPFFYPRIY